MLVRKNDKEILYTGYYWKCAEEWRKNYPSGSAIIVPSITSENRRYLRNGNQGIQNW